MIPMIFKDNPKEYYKHYYELNREKIKLKIKKWKLANTESVKKQQAEYRANNQDKILAYRKKFGADYRKVRTKAKLKEDFAKIKSEKQTQSVLFKPTELPQVKKKKFDFNWETMKLNT